MDDFLRAILGAYQGYNNPSLTGASGLGAAAQYDIPKEPTTWDKLFSAGKGAAASQFSGLGALGAEQLGIKWPAAQKRQQYINLNDLLMPQSKSSGGSSAVKDIMSIISLIAML